MTCRVAAIADLHGYLPELPSCDLLLVGGDLCPVSNHGLEYQRWFLGGPFADWLERAEASTIVGIAGNHDFIAAVDPELMRALPWTYLCDETVDVCGLAVHGSPWTPTFGDWAFMLDDAGLAPVWKRIPEDVEVLVTHGPPHGYGDLTMGGKRAGSSALLDRIGDLGRLRLHVFGHIHEAGGSLDRVGPSTLANVSHVDFYYAPVRPAAVFDI